MCEIVAFLSQQEDCRYVNSHGIKIYLEAPDFIVIRSPYPGYNQPPDLPNALVVYRLFLGNGYEPSDFLSAFSLKGLEDLELITPARCLSLFHSEKFEVWVSIITATESIFDHFFVKSGATIEYTDGFSGEKETLPLFTHPEEFMEFIQTGSWPNEIPQ